MDGIEWVVHSSLLQAVAASDFDAQGFLYEILHHHVLALDEANQLRHHYDPWLRGNGWLSRWFQRTVSRAGGIAIYPLHPLENEVQTELAHLAITIADHSFVIVTRQTLDRLLAGDSVSFSPEAQTYLRNHLQIQVIPDWQTATQRGHPLTEARVRWLISQGEGESIEFKLSLTSQLRRAAIETLAAFAAKNGGSVLFGVRDDGVIRGVQMGQNTLENLADEIRANTDPPLTAPHLRIEQFPLNEGVVLTVSIDSVQRECRAYGCICQRVGRQTQRL